MSFALSMLSLSIIRKWWRGLAVLLVLAVVAAVLAWWPVAQPSSAYFVLQPGSQSFTEGQQFDVKVQVQSTKPANAVDATLSYPTDTLDVVGTSSKQSRFDMVLFPAQVDKDKGTVRYLQATAAPFSGASNQGLVGSVTFKAKHNGRVDFDIHGKIVANDSQGTDLTQKQPDKPLWRALLGK